METPNTEGFYFAKSENYKWFNLIAQIYGQSPFFKIRAWHRFHDKIIEINVSDIKEWGPKIVEPD
jgi:hypothetical protein